MQSNHSKIKDLSIIALFAAIMCILGPLSIPIGPVPISLTTFAVFLSVYLLGAKKSAISVIIYLLIGLTGLPVFSGFQGGVAKLAGPTGGYLLGFIPAAIIAGLLISRFAQKKMASIISMILATCILYFIGTAWLAVSLHLTPWQALSAGVIPFIPGDIIKIICAVFAGHLLLKRTPISEYLNSPITR